MLCLKREEGEENNFFFLERRVKLYQLFCGSTGSRVPVWCQYLNYEITGLVLGARESFLVNSFSSVFKTTSCPGELPRMSVPSLSSPARRGGRGEVECTGRCKSCSARSWDQHFSTDVAGGHWFRHNVSDGERWGAAEEASLARPPPTSCYVARFLTGHGIPVRGPGGGDPCLIAHIWCVYPVACGFKSHLPR